MNDGHPENGIAPSERDGPRLREPGLEPGPRTRFTMLLGGDHVDLRRRPWWIVSASMAGLVLAIAIGGFVGLAFNRTVHDTTDGALRYDVALQDAADDLRLAILDVRHLQRNIVFLGPASDRLVDFGDHYVELLEDIEELKTLGISEPSLTQPDELQRMAEEYHANFVPALDLYETDRAAFDVASDDGLVRLAELERSARRMDNWAENQSDSALARVAHASSNAQLVLLIVIGGLILIGAALVYAANRVFAEVRRLYEAEQAASQRLGEALQAKNDFVADASHELRTPLTVLRGNAEAGLAIDPHCAHREILEEIVDESAWMTRLVEDLLFLARSDATAPTLETEPVPVEPLLEEVAERSAVLVRQRGASFSTALTARGTVIADAARIEQAILALVDNAAKFSPPGGRVNLSSSTREGDLIIEVADQGPGIPEAELARIFERFYRTDRARSRRRSGAGLGLSIARTVIEMHNGRIEAISRLGHGTRMRIHLPCAPVRPSALPAAMPSPPAELAAGRVAS